MVARFLNAMVDHLKEDHLQKNQGITFLPTNPITLVQTKNLSVKKLAPFYKALLTHCQRHHLALLQGWKLEFTEKNNAVLRTQQPRINLDIIQHLCREADEHFSLNYPYLLNAHDLTAIEIDLASAFPLLSQCEIGLPYRKLISNRILLLCRQTEHSADKKLGQFAQMVLSSDRDFSEKMRLITRFCTTLASQEKETTFSARLEMVSEAYDLISQALSANQPTPSAPPLQTETLPAWLTHHRNTSLLPSFTLLTTLPEQSVAPDKPLSAFMLDQQLDFCTFLHTLSSCTEKLKQGKNASSIAQHILNELLAIISGTCLTLEKKMLFDSAITACESAKKLLLALKPFASRQQKTDLMEHTIALNIAQTNALINSGNLSNAQTLTQQNLELVAQLSNSSAFKRYQMKSNVLGQQANYAFCLNDLESTQRQLKTTDQFIESGAEQVIPRLPADYHGIAQLISTLQSRRLNSTHTTAMMAMDYLLQGKRHDAYPLFCAAEQKLNACIPEDITRKIKRRFARQLDLSINLSNAEQDSTTQFRRSLQAFSQEIADNNFFECLALFYYIEKKHPEYPIHYQLDEQTIKITLKPKAHQALSNALMLQGIPYQNSEQKKSKKDPSILLHKFAATDSHKLRAALSCVIKTPDTLLTPKPTPATMPKDPTLISLRYQLIKAALKHNYSTILVLKDRLVSLQKNNPSNHVKTYCALLISFACSRLARNALCLTGTSDAMAQASIAQFQLDDLHQPQSSYSKKIAGSIAYLIAHIDRTVAHTATFESTELCRAQMTAYRDAEQNDPRTLYSNMLSLYQDLVRQFSCYNPAIKNTRHELLTELSSWLLIASGKRYFESLPNETETEQAAQNITQLYALILSQHKRNASFKNGHAATFFSLAKLLFNWPQLNSKQKLSAVDSIVPKLAFHQDHSLSLRAKYWHFVLNMQLGRRDTKTYAPILKSLLFIASVAKTENEESDTTTVLVTQFFRSFITEACFTLLEKNRSSLSEYAVLAHQLQQLKNDFLASDETLCDLTSLVISCYEYLCALTEANVEKQTKSDCSVASLTESLQLGSLAITRCIVSLGRHPYDKIETTAHYAPLHQALCAFATAEQQFTRLVPTQSGHSAPFMDCVDAFIRQRIVPNYQGDHHNKSLNNVKLTPYNWYCAVEYGFFPKRNGKTVFDTLRDAHDVRLGIRLSEEDFAVFLQLCDQHPDNAALNFLAARCYLRHDRHNPEGLKHLKQAASTNHALADYYLGKVYRCGFFGKQENPTKAIKHFKRCAEQHNHYQSYYRLARYYFDQGEDDKMKYAAVLAVQYCTLGNDVKNRLMTRFGLSKADLQKKTPEATLRGRK